MPDSIDYDELSDRTIKEIKQEVEDSDVDLEKLLEAEKENKDRVTLKDWLNDRIEEVRAEDAEEDVDTSQDAAEESDEDAGDVSVDEEEHVDTREVVVEDEEPEKRMDMSPVRKPKLTFLGGLVVGILLATIVTYATMGGTAMSPDQARSMTDEYLQNNPNLQGNYTIGEVDARQYQDLYVVPVTLTSQLGEQTLQAYVTKKSGLLFGSTPIDLETGEPVGVSGQAQTGTQNGTSQ